MKKYNGWLSVSFYVYCHLDVFYTGNIQGMSCQTKYVFRPKIQWCLFQVYFTLLSNESIHLNREKNRRKEKQNCQTRYHIYVFSINFILEFVRTFVRSFISSSYCGMDFNIQRTFIILLLQTTIHRIEFIFSTFWFLVTVF